MTREKEKEDKKMARTRKVRGKTDQIYNPKTRCWYKLARQTGPKRRAGQIMGIKKC